MPWFGSAQTLWVYFAMLGICLGVSGLSDTSDLLVFEQCMIWVCGAS